MIAIDSSAIVAILLNEPHAPALLARIAAEPFGERRMSVASYLEIGSVMAARMRGDRHAAVADLDNFLTDLSIALEPVDQAQARIALRARIDFGRGMGHGGPLNFGDCFSYALAKTLAAPLLFIGNDFTETDIAIATLATPPNPPPPPPAG